MPLFSTKLKKPLGIYVHIPFCRSKCHYCDFYSITDLDNQTSNGYLDAICDHIRESGPLAPGYRVDTVYFGGGTPSYFGADALAAILATIRKSFDVASDAEITFEANPDSINSKLLRRLRGEGFNRVSLGVQCTDDAVLQAIGRPHNYQMAVDAVKKIRRAGFKNLSIDLIYGLPDQDREHWEKTLQEALKLQPEHISCYGLKIEEGTPFHQYQNKLWLADDDMQADMYLSTVEILRRQKQVKPRAPHMIPGYFVVIAQHIGAVADEPSAVGEMGKMFLQNGLRRLKKEAAAQLQSFDAICHDGLLSH